MTSFRPIDGPRLVLESSAEATQKWTGEKILEGEGRADPSKGNQVIPKIFLDFFVSSLLLSFETSAPQQ